MRIPENVKPGRQGRKLLSLSDELFALRMNGYTLRSLQEILKANDVLVSIQTISVELKKRNGQQAKPRKDKTTVDQSTEKQDAATGKVETPQTEQALRQPQAKRQRVNVAEFFANAVDNPLITRKQGPKP